MEMISGVLWVRMAVQPTLPDGVSMRFSIVDCEIVVRISSDRESSVLYHVGIVPCVDVDTKYKRSDCITDCRGGHLVRGFEVFPKKFENRSIDVSSAPA